MLIVTLQTRPWEPAGVWNSVGGFRESGTSRDGIKYARCTDHTESIRRGTGAISVTRLSRPPLDRIFPSLTSLLPSVDTIEPFRNARGDLVRPYRSDPGSEDTEMRNTVNRETDDPNPDGGVREE